MLKCERCNKNSNSFIMSILNLEIICTECQKKEKKHVLFKLAKDIELEELKKGNYNYEGILQNLKGNRKEKVLQAMIKFEFDKVKTYNYFSDFINSLSFKPEKLAKLFDENLINFTDEATSFLVEFSKQEKSDIRTEDSLNFIKKLKLKNENIEILPLCKLFMKEHPSIKQQYAAFCLSYLMEEEVKFAFI